MDDDFFRHDSKSSPARRDNLFVWTVLILLLIGAALASWLGSFYIFGHPENPRSYKILKKLKKIEPPKRFELTSAPPGEFLTPQKLYERYINFSKLDLNRENDELMRNYVSNYQKTKKLVPYIVGRFNILDSFELKKSDIFSSGIVALAQGGDFSQVLIEHVYTAEAVNVPVLQKMLMTGLDIKLERTLDLSAIIHIEKLYDGRLQFTVVPLLYGSYALKQGTGRFSLEPPPDINLETDLPIVKSALLLEAYKTYAEFRKRKGPEPISQKTAIADSPASSPTTSTLVRVDTSPPPDAIPSTMPIPTPKTSAIAKTTPKSTKPAATSTPITIAANTTPRLASPAPTPASVSPQGVPLEPFLVSAPNGLPITSGGSWRTFSPGQIPRGKIVNVPEAAALADLGTSGEKIYLQGEFVVTASGENRAVLRPPGPQSNTASNTSKLGTARIIVEFPSGSPPPEEGTTFSRDEKRPLQITDVRRGADGQINIYVREITK